jgi:hypothetical protein
MRRGEIIQKDECVNSNLLTPGGREADSQKPAIYYQPCGGRPTDVVTNSRISEDESTKFRNIWTV